MTEIIAWSVFLTAFAAFIVLSAWRIRELKEDREFWKGAAGRYRNAYHTLAEIYHRREERRQVKT